MGFGDSNVVAAAIISAGFIYALRPLGNMAAAAGKAADAACKAADAADTKAAPGIANLGDAATNAMNMARRSWLEHLNPWPK